MAKQRPVPSPRSAKPIGQHPPAKSAPSMANSHQMMKKPYA